MKCSLIAFSPTGGTEKAGMLLCAGIGAEPELFDLSDRTLDYASFSADQDGVAVIAMPSYGGRVPALAAERLQQVQGNGMPCVLLCVYGNRAYEDTLAEMEGIAKDCGFRVFAAVAAIAEHSIMHQYAAGRPDASDEASLKEIGAKIARKLSNLPENDAFTIPGSRPNKKSGSLGLVPKATSACTGCGLCAEGCPADAINRENVNKVDKARCISCMRCVVNCPQNARAVNGLMVSIAAQAIKKACLVRKECELYL